MLVNVTSSYLLLAVHTQHTHAPVVLSEGGYSLLFSISLSAVKNSRVLCHQQAV